MSEITPLPDPPSTADPSNFATEADAFLGALPTFATELNTFGGQLNNLSTSSTSVTSNTIGTGSKAFAVETDKSYRNGMSLTIARTSAPTNRMFAVVNSYNSGTGALVVTSQAFEGSGTFTDWTITLGFNGVIGAGQIASNTAESIVKAALNATGSAPVYACRAWVNFNGTGTVAIRASGNVTSISDGGTGIYTVNFTTALPDANYAANVTAIGSSIGSVAALGTSTLQINTRSASDGSLLDRDTVFVSVFR